MYFYLPRIRDTLYLSEMRDPCESQQNQNRQRETVGASLLVAEDVKSEEWPEEETFVKRVNQPVEKGGGGGGEMVRAS